MTPTSKSRGRIDANTITGIRAYDFDTHQVERMGTRWAKILHSQTGHWHAWGPLGGKCTVSRKEQPSPFSRSTPHPNRPCITCLKESST